MILHWKVWKRMALRYQQNSEFGLYFELLVRKRNPCTRPIMLIPPFPLLPLLRNNCMKNRNTNRIVDSIDPLMVVVRIPSKRRKCLFLIFTLSCISQTWMTFEILSMKHFFVMWRSEKLSSQRYLTKWPALRHLCRNDMCGLVRCNCSTTWTQTGWSEASDDEFEPGSANQKLNFVKSN